MTNDIDEPVQEHWLKRYHLSVRIIAAVCLFWCVAGIALYHSKIGDYFEAKFSAPINFGVRQAFGLTPKQNPKLKIFAIDDSTFAWLGTASPELKLWGDLLDAIAENKPKLIVIDDMLSSRPSESAKDLQFYFSRLKELGVPVALGAFTSPSPLGFKTPLDMSETWYQLGHYLPRDGVVAEGRGIESHVPKWKIRDTWHAYGPAEELRPWFKKIGHFQLLSDQKVEPFLRLSETLVLPHISLFAADDIRFVNGNLRIDGRRVALDRLGAIDVNFAPYSSWKVRSLLEPLKKAQSGFVVNNIDEGDVVLILPLYFTGNTDFRTSPFGLIPGGLYLAAMLNSVLNGEWLQPVLAMEVITIIALIALGLTITPFRAFFFWSGVGGFAIALFLLSQIFFSFFGLVIPWLLPTFTVLSAAVHLFVLKMKAHEHKVVMLRSALEGAVDPVQLEGLLRRPETVSLEPRERVVTLMFVDIVGFSLSAENMLPRLAFDHLKELLGKISGAVHDCGGVVDKSLGDGLLCYFGYRFDSDETISNHAELALRCAIRIQTENLQMNAASLASGQTLYPLRIGINTASCYLGDLGTENRIEFTVVGNGVNFAKRLEGACEMFSILMGANTWELVRGLDFDHNAATRRLIRIKHHKELIDAFEYDPNALQRETRLNIIDAFRKATNLQRLNERIPVNDPLALELTCDKGRGIVMNFSGTGISLQLDSALARGQRVTIFLNSPDQRLLPSLKEIGLEHIEAEVRWNYQSTLGFVHGFAFKNLSEQQSESFVQVVSEFAFKTLEKHKRNDDLEKLAM